ncbi:MAG: SUMF1/EgtB/PvdO family nonheme iron enzyme [Spirochaetaceae bacterium]
MARTSKSESPEPKPVRLKPVFGIKPESYVPILLGVGLLLLLFLLLIYPGVRNHGSEVTVRSTPAGSEVVVDGVRLGATPVTRFVPAGEHRLSIHYPGYEVREVELPVRGRLFGTLFVPRKQRITVTLTPLDPEELAAERAEDFARWALAGAGSAAFQVPPIIAETGRALGAYPEHRDSVIAGRGLLRTARYHIASSTQLKDLTRGTVLMNGLGGPSPLGVTRSVLELVQPANDSPGSAALQTILDRTLPDSLASRFREGGWYEESRSLPLDGSAGEGENPAPPELTVAGMPFRRTDGVLMMEREVTRGDFARFLEDTPAWRLENREELVEAGTVTKEYLADWDENGRSEEPIRYVSWHAAAAFADWMGERLEESYPEYRGELAARLPRVTEWRTAAATEPRPGSGENGPGRITFESEGETPSPIGRERRSGAGFYDLYGNLWEWGAEWYTPSPEAKYLAGSSEAQIGGAERVVQGGSFANTLRELSGEPIGSQPPSWCSPYLGFRLVLAPTEEEL